MGGWRGREWREGADNDTLTFFSLASFSSVTIVMLLLLLLCTIHCFVIVIFVIVYYCCFPLEQAKTIGPRT